MLNTTLTSPPTKRVLVVPISPDRKFTAILNALDIAVITYSQERNKYHFPSLQGLLRKEKLLSDSP